MRRTTSHGVQAAPGRIVPGQVAPGASRGRRDGRPTAIRRLLVATLASSLVLALGAWCVSERDAAETARLSPIASPSASGTLPQASAWNAVGDAYPGCVAWLQVESRSISVPVMQSTRADPDFFLDHDAHGAMDPKGLPYLDWRTKASGALRVVYGHNWGFGSSDGFSALADSWRGERFAELGEALWARPGEPAEHLVPLCASLRARYDPIEVPSSIDRPSSLRQWLRSTCEGASVQGPKTSALIEGARSALVLVTCSGDLADSSSHVMAVWVSVGSGEGGEVGE